MSFLGAPGAARVRVGAQSKAPSIVHWNDSLWGSWPLPLPHLPSKQSAKELCLTDSLEQKGKEKEEEEGRKREEEGRKRKKGGSGEVCVAGTNRARIYYPTPYRKFAEPCT